jgi:hexulose-6-phosphate isomerase
MRVRPSIRMTALPQSGPYAERLRLAVEAGFEGLELDTGIEDAAEIADAAAGCGIEIHSVGTLTNWSHPLSSADPAVLARGIESTLAELRVASMVGAETLQLVPGLVTDAVPYKAAYDRSQQVIAAEILPVAAELGIIIGVENVWNGFLLGPVEYARYCDEFDSPWVRPYLDVGNVIFGRPEDWIDIVGKRLVKLHLKDFRLEERGSRYARFDARKIGEGVVDWARVCAALERIGFEGWGTFAQAEEIQGLAALKLQSAARRLARMPGPRRATGFAQIWLARRLLNDVMDRYRRHLVQA